MGAGRNAGKSEKLRLVTEYVNAYESDLYHVAFYIAKDSHLAEDAVQTALLSFFEHFDHVRDVSVPEVARAYLLICTKNAACNLLRTETRQAAVREKLSALYSLRKLQTMEEDLAQKADREALLQALDVIAQSQSEILLRRFFLGESPATIAAALGLPREAVYQTCHNGKRALSKLMGEVSRK